MSSSCNMRKGGKNTVKQDLSGSIVIYRYDYIKNFFFFFGQEIDLEENPIRSSVLDQIESEIQFQILIRVSEPKEGASAEEMD